MRAAHTSCVRTWLRSDPLAADVPWLGDSMTPLMWNGPLGTKITIAVVGDGFAAQDQDNKAVDNLLMNGLFAQDFYLANKLAFNLLRVNLVSADSGVSTKTYGAAGNVIAQTDRNTALGAYFNGDWAHCWVEDGPNTAARLSLALSIWVPDHRLVLVLLNNPGFGGCGGGGRVTLPLGVTWSTIAHEFGHALGGLADEYHQLNETYAGGEPGASNATINTNRTTLKWARAARATTPIPTGDDDYTRDREKPWEAATTAALDRPVGTDQRPPPSPSSHGLSRSPLSPAHGPTGAPWGCSPQSSRSTSGAVVNFGGDCADGIPGCVRGAGRGGP
jgi:hypothetical protein